MEKRGKIIEKHTKLETLYKLLSGNMSGNRMDLETYVQRYYLEKILYAANRRFANMSAGQFELRMVDEENAGKGKNRGLDLMVYSNVTGKEREVRTLSGGERQRLGLARAFLHDAPFMLLDEPTSNLDSLNEAVILKSLEEERNGKTVVLVSHRESTMQIADVVYSVERGRMS